MKAKDVVGDHWKMEAKLLGVSSRLRKVGGKFQGVFFWFINVMCFVEVLNSLDSKDL